MAGDRLDVVGIPFFVGGSTLCVQFEMGVELFRRWGVFLALCLWLHFGFDQVSWAPCLPGPDLALVPGGEDGSGVTCCGLGMPTRCCSIVAGCDVGFGSASAGWIGWP